MSEQEYKPVDLEPYKDALQIVRTGQDKAGTKFNDIGKLNQAAWIGENAGRLIKEIEILRARVAELEKDKK